MTRRSELKRLGCAAAFVLCLQLSRCSTEDVCATLQTGLLTAGINTYEVPSRCKLGIVNAGMPRSGSTLLYEMLTIFTSHAFATAEHKHPDVRSTYWNYHLHRLHYAQGSIEQARQELSEHEQKFSSITKDTVVIAKSHIFNGDLLHLCDATVVITVTRNFCDIALSVAHLGWSPYDSAEGYRIHFEQSTNNDQCWRSRAHALAQHSSAVHHIPTTYNELSTEPGQFFTRLARAISATGIAMPGLEAALEAVSRPPEYDINPEFSGRKYRDGHGGSALLGPTVQQLFNQHEVIAWQENNGYDNWCARNLTQP